MGENTLIEDLVKYGLSEKEAKLYIGLLKLEVASANELAKETNVNRSSTYVVLESLKDKGLVATSDNSTIQKYVASSPDVLLRSAKDSLQKQAGVLESIEEALPELKGLFRGLKKKPKVVVYEGPEGVKSAMEHSLNCKEGQMRVASSLTKVSKILSRGFLVDYVNKRIEAGIKMKGIHPDDWMAKMLSSKTSSDKIDDIIFVPKRKFKFPTDMAVYDDFIGFASAQDGGVGIIIENKEMAETTKHLFDLAWEGAKSIEGHKRKA